VGTIFGIYKAKNPGSGKYSLDDVLRVGCRLARGLILHNYAYQSQWGKCGCCFISVQLMAHRL
jgi:hypothetical protein